MHPFVGASRKYISGALDYIGPTLVALLEHIAAVESTLASY